MEILKQGGALVAAPDLEKMAKVEGKLPEQTTILGVTVKYTSKPTTTNATQMVANKMGAGGGLVNGACRAALRVQRQQQVYRAETMAASVVALIAGEEKEVVLDNQEVTKVLGQQFWLLRPGIRV